MNHTQESQDILVGHVLWPDCSVWGAMTYVSGRTRVAESQADERQMGACTGACRTLSDALCNRARDAGEGPVAGAGGKLRDAFAGLGCGMCNCQACVGQEVVAVLSMIRQLAIAVALELLINPMRPGQSRPIQGSHTIQGCHTMLRCPRMAQGYAEAKASCAMDGGWSYLSTLVSIISLDARAVHRSLCSQVIISLDARVHVCRVCPWHVHGFSTATAVCSLCHVPQRSHCTFIHAHAVRSCYSPTLTSIAHGAHCLAMGVVRRPNQRSLSSHFAVACPRPHSRLVILPATSASAASRSSADRLAAAVTAAIAADRKPLISSASTPAIVVPPGEQTCGKMRGG